MSCVTCSQGILVAVKKENLELRSSRFRAVLSQLGVDEATSPQSQDDPEFIEQQRRIKVSGCGVFYAEGTGNAIVAAQFDMLWT